MPLQQLHCFRKGTAASEIVEDAEINTKVHKV